MINKLHSVTGGGAALSLLSITLQYQVSIGQILALLVVLLQLLNTYLLKRKKQK
jgi:hypothetical protein